MNNKVKIVLAILVSLFTVPCIIILVYMVSGLSEYPNIVQRYNEVGQSKVSGNGDGNKKLNFLVSYYAETKDLELSVKLGNKGQDSQMSQAGGSSDPGDTGNQDPGGTGGTGGLRTKWDTTTVNDAIKKQCDGWGVTNPSTLWNVVDRGGVMYIYENQSKTYYKNMGANSKVSAKGCMLFAMAACLSNLKGEVIGVEDMLTELGHTITYSSSEGFKDKNSSLKNVGLGDSSWNHPDGTNCTPSSIFDRFGVKQVCHLNATSSGNGGLSTGEKGLDKIRGIIDKGHLAMVHVTDGSNTFTTTEHYFVVVGRSNDEYYCICVSSSRTCSQKFTSSQWKKITKLNKLWEVWVE